MYPRWLIPLRKLAALLAAWGLWIAAVTRTEISTTYSLMMGLADIRVQGALIGAAGVVALALARSGPRARVVSAAIVSSGWAWVWVTLLLGQWTSTATLVYGAILLEASSISASAWGEWIKRRRGRDAGEYG